MKYNLDINVGDLIELPYSNEEGFIRKGKVFDVDVLGRAVFFREITNESEDYHTKTFRNVKKYVEEKCMFLLE